MITTEYEYKMDNALDLFSEQEESTEEATYRREFIAAVQEGIDAMNRGEVISLEEMQKEILSWIAK